MSHALRTEQLSILNDQARLPVLANVAVRFAAAVTAWETRRTSRRALKQLDGRLLNDIGLDPLTAHTEAAKPFWQV